jgi:hypothetical protein
MYTFGLHFTILRGEISLIFQYLASIFITIEQTLGCMFFYRNICLV